MADWLGILIGLAVIIAIAAYDIWPTACGTASRCAKAASA